jgi:BioD-like phosphotransacetylase family protein
MKSKILFLTQNEVGNLEKTKQKANSLVITSENKDDIIEILIQTNTKIYNGTNKYFQSRKEITNFINKYT